MDLAKVVDSPHGISFLNAWWLSLCNQLMYTEVIYYLYSTYRFQNPPTTLGLEVWVFFVSKARFPTSQKLVTQSVSFQVGRLFNGIQVVTV